MIEEDLMKSVLNKLDIQSEIRKIIKDSEFQTDKATGYRYIKNRVDDTKLFEYSPTYMVLYYSKHITNYLLYRKYNKHNIEKHIKTAVEYLFNIKFSECYEIEKSMIDNVKKSKFNTEINNKTFDGILSIPDNFFIIDKLYFELINCKNDYSRDGYTRKFAFESFDNLDISGMCNGIYGLYIYQKGIFNDPMKFRITINNSIEKFKNKNDN